MKKELYDIMSVFNDIINEIKDMEKVVEIQFHGIEQGCDSETARSVLATHLRLLQGIHNNCEELYNRIDEMSLSRIEV